MPPRMNQTQAQRDAAIAAWIARRSAPVSSPGKWYPASAIRNRSKSFGLFKCSCKHWWESAHTYVNDDDGWQECNKCSEHCYPIAMWVNDVNKNRRRPSRDSSEPQNGKPHERSLCGMCIKSGQPCWETSAPAPEVSQPRSTATIATSPAPEVSQPGSTATIATSPDPPRPPTQSTTVARRDLAPQPAQNVLVQRMQQQSEAERQSLAEERQRHAEAEHQRLAEADRLEENTIRRFRRLLGLIRAALTLVFILLLYRAWLKLVEPPPPPPPSYWDKLSSFLRRLIEVGHGIPMVFKTSPKSVNFVLCYMNGFVRQFLVLYQS